MTTFGAPTDDLIVTFRGHFMYKKEPNEIFNDAKPSCGLFTPKRNRQGVKQKL